MLFNQPTLIIKLLNGRIYYTQNDYIHIENTNFPSDHRVVYSGKENFYSVNIIEIGSNKLKLNYLYCLFSKYDEFYNQSKVKDFKGEDFKFIEITGLEAFGVKSVPQFRSETDNSIRDKKTEIKNTSINPKYLKVKPASEYIKQESIPVKKVSENIEPIEIPVKKIVEEFKYSFKDAKFEKGCVVILKKFHFLNRKVELKIYNSFIESEYDYIKYYFAKILKSRTFIVNTHIQIRGDEILWEESISKEIDEINEQIISRIKEERTKKVLKIISIELAEKKSTYTANELLTSVENDNGGNIFKQDGEDIIKTLLNSKGIRSAKQFQYLGGLKHNVERNVQFTLKPNFGFLFYVKGEKNTHFCWELLESHATYIWSFDKSYSYEDQLSRLNQTLYVIQKKGRNLYKRLRKEEGIDSDIVFNTIIHKSTTNTFKDSFLEWKDRVNKILV